MKTILRFWIGGFPIACGIVAANSIRRGCNIGEYFFGTLFAGICIGWGLFLIHEAMKDNK